MGVGGMKKLVTVQEVENEGLVALLGQTVMTWCLDGFIYTGVLEGVNGEVILLNPAAQVFETGGHLDTNWKDAQKLPHPLYIPKNALGPITITDKRVK